MPYGVYCHPHICQGQGWTPQDPSTTTAGARHTPHKALYCHPHAIPYGQWSPTGGHPLQKEHQRPFFRTSPHPGQAAGEGMEERTGPLLRAHYSAKRRVTSCDGRGGMATPPPASADPKVRGPHTPRHGPSALPQPLRAQLHIPRWLL